VEASQFEVMLKKIMLTYKGWELVHTEEVE